MTNLNEVFISCNKDESNTKRLSLEDGWTTLQKIMAKLSNNGNDAGLNNALIKDESGKFFLNESRFDVGGAIDNDTKTLKLYFNKEGINENDPLHKEKSLIYSFLESEIKDANFVLLNTHGVLNNDEYNLEILEKNKELNENFKSLENCIIWLNSCYETSYETHKRHLENCRTKQMENSLTQKLAKNNTVIAASFRLPKWFIHEINCKLVKMLPLYSGLSICSFFKSMIKNLCSDFLPADEADFKKKYSRISGKKGSICTNKECQHVFPDDFLAPLFFWIYGDANLCVPYCAKKIESDSKLVEKILPKTCEPGKYSHEKPNLRDGNLFLDPSFYSPVLSETRRDKISRLWLLSSTHQESETEEKLPVLIAATGNNEEFCLEILEFIEQKIKDNKFSTIIILDFEPNTAKEKKTGLKAEHPEKITIFNVLQNTIDLCHLSKNDIWMVRTDIEAWLENYDDPEKQEALNFFYPQKEQKTLLYLASCGLHFPKINTEKEENIAALEIFSNKIS
jgi:FtsZ-binding cell division protein ZapB